MKRLQREMQPAKAKPVPEPTTKGAAAPARALAAEAFTARELDAAEQLIHLSESSASSGTTGAHPVAYAAASGGSSPRSVNGLQAPAPGAVFLSGCADPEEEEEQEVAGSQRRAKRYRLIAEIYAATEDIGGRSGRKNRKD
ncbi:hypothetical protein ACQJBY_045183 [Aegilops geniculata]